MSNEQLKVVSDVSHTRNSKLRERTAGITRKVAEAIDENLPYVTPDMVTALSCAGTIFGGHIANKESKPNKKLALGIIAASQALDAIDGALARVRERKNKINNPDGQLVDVLGDRTSEAGLGLIRAESAHNRNDILGEYSALLATATNPLPSTSRALAEANGYCVEESGNTFLTFLGTRAGRAILATVATVFPRPKGIPLQAGLDSLTAYANIKTTIDRVNKTKNSAVSEPVLSTDDREKAKRRLKAMAVFTAATAGAVIYTLNRDKQK